MSQDHSVDPFNTMLSKVFDGLDRRDVKEVSTQKGTEKEVYEEFDSYDSLVLERSFLRR